MPTSSEQMRSDVIREAADGGRATPRVSIITPFLDPPASFLIEAVESVLAQTFTDWEFLLVNDGSGPAASALARELAGRDPARIRCLAHPDGANHGIPASRNAGLTVARGEFIAYLDSDDVWLPHKLQEQVGLLDAYPAVDMLFGRSLYWRSWAGRSLAARDRLAPLGVRDRTVLRSGEFLRRMLVSQLIVPCPSSILVRAAAARAVNGFEATVSNYYEDQGFYAKVSLAGEVLACEQVWDRYRLHPGSVIGAASRRQLADARQQYLEWLSAYLDNAGVDVSGIRREIRLERWALSVPRGTRMLRYLRRLAALPRRLGAGTARLISSTSVSP